MVSNYKKILVTGADGFLGSNLIRELLDRGYRVRGLVEPGSRNNSLKTLDIEILSGDILDPRKVKEALEGCSSIIHTAAVTATWPSRSEIVKKVNVQGTKNIIDAAKEKGVERLVYVGSANSFGFGSKEDPGDETRPYSAFKYGLDYFNSKYEAQSMVLEEIRENDLKAVIVNPTFLVGPYDAKPGFGVIILAIYMGRMPGCASGGRNYIHVRDAAAGIVNAFEKGRIGECYILGNRNLSYRELFDMIANEIGVKAPKFNYPRPLVKVYGLLGSVIGTIANKKNVVSFTLAKIACDEHYYTAKKAVKELGLPQTPIETAINDAFLWFKHNGYLERKL